MLLFGGRLSTQAPNRRQKSYARREMKADGNSPFRRRRESARIRNPDAGDPARSSTFVATVMRQAAPYMGVAWNLTAAVIVGVFGGRWLDGRWGTAPWLTLGGVLLGAAVGLYQVGRLALRTSEKPGRDESGGKDGGPTR